MANATVYRAAWVLPVTSPPVRDGAVRVGVGGTIEAVGPGSEIGSAGARLIDLGDAVLLPGLVNVHAHPELAMFRGGLEDLAFRDWIARLLRTKTSGLEDRHYLAAARWTAVEALHAGITTVGATEASGAAVAAFSEAGLRAVVYQEAFGPAPGQAGDSLRELREAVTRLRPLASDLVEIGVSPHAPYTVSDELYRSVSRWARDEGMKLATHIAESTAERELVTGGGGDFAEPLRRRGIKTPVRGTSPIRLLHELGVLGPATLLVHCVGLDEDDARLIARSGAAVAHCPIANARLGHGVAPLPILLDHDVPVGLGTDSVASNNRLDVLEEARVASLLQRAVHRSPALLPPDALLRLATLEGARALGYHHRIGSLEPGKEADLCAVSVAAPHARPVLDPTATLFHSTRATDVVLTVVRGRVLYRNGRILSGLDVDDASRVLEEAADRLRELR